MNTVIAIATVLREAFTLKRTALKKIDEANEKLGSALEAPMQFLIDQWVAANVPKTESGMKTIDKMVNQARKILAEDKRLKYEHATIANYITGAKRSFVAGMPWKSTAFQAPEKSGIPAFPWSKRAKVPAEKPSKVEVSNIDTLNVEVTRILGEIRKFKGDGAADDVLEALLKHGFKVTPVPPQTSTLPAKKPVAKKAAAKKAAAKKPAAKKPAAKKPAAK